MALIPRLELRQSQALVMTPQLQQAIKLLQLSNIDLIQYVEQELEQNPLLERGEDDYGVEDGLGPAKDAADSGDESLDDDSEEPGQTPLEAPLEALDADYNTSWDEDGPSDVLPGDFPLGGGIAGSSFAEWGKHSGGFGENAPNFEETLSDKPRLREHLIGQMTMGLNGQVDRVIGLVLIDALDETGYVSAGLGGVAAALNCAVERVEAVLSKLQKFDPPGIFARNLSECLALQLKDKDRLDPAMQALLDNLDLLAKRDMTALIEVCGVDEEDIAGMAAEIRALDPKPALNFDSETVQPIVPDVLMRAKPGGGWLIELNTDTLPRVLVNNSYHAYISAKAGEKKDRQYISDCLQSANWLVKSLHQRATTILKVSSEIVRQQDGFFAHGVECLRPLVLRDIAEAIEMHESTISRVTSNKYIASPRGIYELKYFFTPAIASSSGGLAHSAESVRHRIKDLIGEEPASKTLSDGKIVAILKNEGIDIARRTVAKYREAMGIASSVQRRREKSANF